MSLAAFCHDFLFVDCEEFSVFDYRSPADNCAVDVGTAHAENHVPREIASTEWGWVIVVNEDDVGVGAWWEGVAFREKGMQGAAS